MIDARSLPATALSLGAHATCWSSPAGHDRTGGDWCETVAVSEDILALTVGDVAGHGESASAAMELVRCAALEAVRESRIPSLILAKLNNVAFACDSTIATAIVAFVDRRQRTFTFANAGHPPPLLVTGSRATFLSQSPGDLPLGIFPWHRCAAHVVALPPDALITLYTDGVTEHEHDPIRGERELARACRSAHERMEHDAARAIAERVFRNGRGQDDAAVVAVHTTPERTSPRWARLKAPLPTRAFAQQPERERAASRAGESQAAP